MGKATLWMHFRQTIGRALRETGQALDRVAVMAAQHAVTTREVGDDPYIFDDHLSRHRHRFPLLKRGQPLIDPGVAYLAPCSTLIGSVRVHKGASIWYKAIIRADHCVNALSYRRSDEEEMEQVLELDPYRMELASMGRSTGGAVYIGENSNVQDGCIVTASVNNAVVGKGVTIGHLAQVHSATIGDYCLIGMGALLNHNVKVENESFIAAGAVVPADTTIPSGELWVGHPAKKLRDLTSEERAKLKYQADEVCALSVCLSVCVCVCFDLFVFFSNACQYCSCCYRYC